LSERDENEQQPSEQAEQPAPEAEAPPAPDPESEPEPAPESKPEPEPEQPAAATEPAPETEVEEPVETEAAPEAPQPEAGAEPARSLAELAAGARYSATGKRKSSVARVILMPGSGEFRLNGHPLERYFPRMTHQVIVKQPLEAAGFVGRIDVVARIHGGGTSGQADAVRHGIAKALIEADPALRGELKRRQLLTRDPRVKERRKAGLKKARKRPQFSKR
jgi:small subunit ribosomal protein S9